ncbi:hypothetical protein ACXWTF_12540 [Thiomicrolovo sp. ZZH C-3]
MKRIAGLLLVGTTLMANPSTSRGGWISTMFSDLAFDYFVRSFEILPELKVCKPSSVEDGLFGVRIRHSDVFLFTETVREKGYTQALDTNILGDTAGGSSTALKYMGTNGEKEGSQYVNALELPFIGMAAKKLSETGLFCFHPGTKTSFYFSWMDPTSTDYMKAKVMPELALLMNIPGIASEVLDCVATTTYSALPWGSKYSSVGKASARVIDMMHHTIGCDGVKSLGNANLSESPLVNSFIISNTALYEMARYGVMVKQSKSSVLNEGRDVECGAKAGPIIKTQFVPQLIRPVPGYVFENGASPAEWAAFKNDATTAGDTVFGWWVRKEFVAFAARCVW